MKKFLINSKYVFVFCVIMFIVETFYPLGDLVQYHLGMAGILIGHIIAIWGLIGLIVILVELYTKHILRN